MKRNLLSGILMLLCIVATAQTASYFEVYTKPAHGRSGGGFTLKRDSLLARINNVPDTTSTFATFVMSLEEPNSIDSVYFTLTNSNSQNVYTGALSHSALQSHTGYRLSGNTLYLTVGPYPYLKRFTGTAQVKYTGAAAGSIRSFAKN